jgi:hypothetical protein
MSPEALANGSAGGSDWSAVSCGVQGAAFSADRRGEDARVLRCRGALEIGGQRGVRVLRLDGGAGHDCVRKRTAAGSIRADVRAEKGFAMVRIGFDLDEGALSSVRQDPETFTRELRIAAAVKWYELRRISQGRAAEIAGLSRATSSKH